MGLATVAAKRTGPKLLLCCASRNRHQLLPAQELLSARGFEVEIVPGLEAHPPTQLILAMHKHGTDAAYVICGVQEIDSDSLDRLKALLRSKGIPNERILTAPLDWRHPLDVVQQVAQSPSSRALPKLTVADGPAPPTKAEPKTAAKKKAVVKPKTKSAAPPPPPTKADPTQVHAKLPKPPAARPRVASPRPTAELKPPRPPGTPPGTTVTITHGSAPTTVEGAGVEASMQQPQSSSPPPSRTPPGWQPQAAAATSPPPPGPPLTAGGVPPGMDSSGPHTSPRLRATPPPDADLDQFTTMGSMRRLMHRATGSPLGIAVTVGTLALIGVVAIAVSQSGGDGSNDAGQKVAAAAASSAQATDEPKPSTPTPTPTKAAASDEPAEAVVATPEEPAEVESEGPEAPAEVPAAAAPEEEVALEEPAEVAEAPAPAVTSADADAVYAALEKRRIRALDIMLVAPEPYYKKRRRRRARVRRMTFAKAEAYCNGLDIDAVSGWRLASIGELGSLSSVGMLPNGKFWTTTKADAFGDQRVVWNNKRDRMGPAPVGWKGGRVVCVRNYSRR